MMLAAPFSKILRNAARVGMDFQENPARLDQKGFELGDFDLPIFANRRGRSSIGDFGQRHGRDARDAQDGLDGRAAC